MPDQFVAVEPGGKAVGRSGQKIVVVRTAIEGQNEQIDVMEKAAVEQIVAAAEASAVAG